MRASTGVKRWTFDCMSFCHCCGSWICHSGLPSFPGGSAYGLSVTSARLAAAGDGKDATLNEGSHAIQMQPAAQIEFLSYVSFPTLANTFAAGLPVVYDLRR